MFTLHPRLVEDTILVAEWPLSLVLLAKDANYPWCILVPRREGIKEIHHLNGEDRTQLLAESCRLSELMEAMFQPIKMNVAALGNMVPQLHVHHVARFDNDVSWPNPIWGVAKAIAYDDEILNARVNALRVGCEGCFKSSLK
jgi:diadenosine tetraphosphate (Ap4A) HIT family hydrolase